MHANHTTDPARSGKKTDPERFDSAEKERYQYGRSLRKQCPRELHAAFQADGRDPVKIHLALTRGRIDELLPIRYERLLESPFAHFRGSAAIMAHDLAQQAATGLEIQICGDCHVLNFGGFATPERKVVFDINDFDETLAGPWEWDVKRLAASIVIAARGKGFVKKTARDLAYGAVKAYVASLSLFAQKSALELWYADIAFDDMVQSAKDPFLKKSHRKKLEKALENSPHEKEFSKMTVEENGSIVIADNPPLLYHLETKAQAALLIRAEKSLALRRPQPLRRPADARNDGVTLEGGQCPLPRWVSI